MYYATKAVSRLVGVSVRTIKRWSKGNDRGFQKPELYDGEYPFWLASEVNAFCDKNKYTQYKTHGKGFSRIRHRLSASARSRL